MHTASRYICGSAGLPRINTGYAYCFYERTDMQNQSIYFAFKFFQAADTAEDASADPQPQPQRSGLRWP